MKPYLIIFAWLAVHLVRSAMAAIFHRVKI